jgi:transmembrane sensor
MPDKGLIRKYLDGSATEEEAMKVIDYLASEHSDMHPLQACYDETPDAGPEQVGSVTTGNMELRNEVLSSLRQRLYPGLVGELTAETKIVPLSMPRLGRYSVAVAAALVVIMGSALLFNLQRPRAATEMAEQQWKTLRNTDIRTRLGILPDGSQFYLSPNSTLSYAADFREHRAVKLEGEAFFDVARDDRYPFEVRTGRITTHVLGTAFNIEAYKEERTVRVSLVRGRVAIRQDSINNSSGLPKVLQAGEALTYYKDSDRTSLEALKINNVYEWENGYTLFNEVSVTAALGRIAHQYGLRLHIQEEKGLESKHITGVFKQQPLTQTLDIILFISRYKYRIQGDTLSVFPR